MCGSIVPTTMNLEASARGGRTKLAFVGGGDGVAQGGPPDSASRRASRLGLLAGRVVAPLGLQRLPGTTVDSFRSSSGQHDLSFFSLRGLGPIRTRMERSVGIASASCDSDAIAAAATFVTDNYFEVFKSNS